MPQPSRTSVPHRIHSSPGPSVTFSITLVFFYDEELLATTQPPTRELLLVGYQVNSAQENCLRILCAYVTEQIFPHNSTSGKAYSLVHSKSAKVFIFVQENCTEEFYLHE